MCFTAQPKETVHSHPSLTLIPTPTPTPTPTSRLGWPRLAVSVVASLISSLAAEYENFVWANLLYGILIVFAQLKLSEWKARKLAAENSKRKRKTERTENWGTAVVC